MSDDFTKYWTESPIGQIERSPTKQVRVKRMTKDTGEVYIDIRHYYFKDGDWLPERKGIWLQYPEAFAVAKLILEHIERLSTPEGRVEQTLAGAQAGSTPA